MTDIKAIAEKAALMLTDEPPAGPAEAFDMVFPFLEQVRRETLEQCLRIVENRSGDMGVIASIRALIPANSAQEGR